MINSIVIILIILIIPCASFGAPVITSAPALSDGQAAIITGTGFGAKSPAAPYLWAPFTTDINPSNLGVATEWGGTEFATWATGEGHTGGALKGSPYDDAHPVTAYVTTTGWNLNDYGQKWYVSRREKHNFVFTGNNNWKYLRAWPAAYGQPDFYIKPTSWGEGQTGTWITEGIADSDGTWTSNGIGTENQFNLEEFEVQSNSGSGAGDGVLNIYRNSALLLHQTTLIKLKDDADTMTLLFPVNAVFEASGSTDYPLESGVDFVWYDDVYVDNSWARVMVCSGATWAARGSCEIQIPSAWSATEITVTAHAGALSSGYLYVVDAAGDANANGTSVTFGGDSTAPTVTASFTIPATSTTLTVSISSFTATDAVGVTGYCVNESATPPTSGSCNGSGWAGSAQTSYLFGSAGSKTLYAWAKDAAGNISDAVTDGVEITLPVATLTGTSPSAGCLLY